ncbi:hypothetical protein [Mangrovibacterium diazotrophicum]|uniref:Outer membrane protein with beta-barrel domain n=1 Tax=Mangrovibacterium diazotrophicum TaxID=1261403 RepID=A0A419VYL9_9BACT|nr:hypothetical protein [Mangrovibacterium diazotrophicum]RKD88316.1 hypothetical protein BC643_3461 [Mangrovibacterium diazotrophicum]
MKKKIKIAVVLLMAMAAFSSTPVFAEETEAPVAPSAPIPFEVFLGKDGFTSQLIVDKKFAGLNKFGLFGLSFLKADYDNEEFLRESINMAVLKYDVVKNVSVVGGALFNSNWGFRPYAGAQYGYHSRTFMGLLSSGFHLTETHNFESLAIVEYRPQIKDAWSLYTRAQGLYSHLTETGKHDRSFLYSRVGVSYKTLSFGAALNYDWYGNGPMKIENHQLGIFISTILN